MVRLYVNVDHVATVREARQIDYPDPVRLAALAEDGGADGITVHLREDRRHIQDHDVYRLKSSLRRPLNFELAVSDEVVAICLAVVPEQATLVPEKREEVTTEGGLDVVRGFDRIRAVTAQLQAAGILVSLFIDPDLEAIRASRACGASHIELHTGAYANARGEDLDRELDALRQGAAQAREAGLVVNAGHGLHLGNTRPIATIPGMNDLNIGHAIVADALEHGMRVAVARMKSLIG
ncbi:MAG: pyridoxine 5'-phosphate synthase [Planctomycetes bacterium]|nr:pyridoxine 5'-phosphate synthase [Planctomycetota bacterium]